MVENMAPLPVGTQVVLGRPAPDQAGQPVPAGAIGRVVARKPGGCYTIQLGDGRTVRCATEQFVVRGDHQREVAMRAAEQAMDGHRLVIEHTIYGSVVGSRAFGLGTEGSDTDVRGVYLAPTPAFWSLAKPPSHVAGPGAEEFSWELERLCVLALKANPNILEVLWSPLVRRMTPVGEELQALRGAFLSRLVYQTYHGYVLSQFRKLEADVRQHGRPRWKHMMHLLRLLLSARTLVATGELELDVGGHRERLLAVRHGELSWDEVQAWRLALHAALEDALPQTPLPSAPDTARVDRWLHDVRARSAKECLG